MFKCILFLAIVMNALVLSGCLKGSFTGPLEFENPIILRVLMQNSAQSALSVNDKTSIPVGGGDFIRAHFSNVPNEPSYSFDINRQSQSRARVFYRVLRFPATSADGPGDLTITVTEPSTGVFDASTSDTLWIRVLSIQVL
jgi:hypothetical protein